VKYSSKKQVIEFYYNEYPIRNVNYEFGSDLYELEIDLIIYKLKTGNKSQVNKLFFNNNDDLTPLIYINSNLFNNYDMFEPNILKNYKTALVLNQMIGYIKITSSNSMIAFNSDRSQFLQNQLTDEIKAFLRNINIRIQSEGSAFKAYLVDQDYLKSIILAEGYNDADEDKLRNVIKDDFKFKNDVIIKKDGNKVIYTIFGKERIAYIKPQSIVPAILRVRQKEKLIQIPSSQIDLREEIHSAIDSKGKNISRDDVEITIDDVLCESPILESITVPCLKRIRYTYSDPFTGIAADEMVIEFYIPGAKILTGDMMEYLITIPARQNYSINYNACVNNLVNQINRLDFNDNKELIACALRAVFEISVDTINKSSKFTNFYQNIKPLEDKVVKTIKYIADNNSYQGYISTQTNIDFNSLKNMLIPDDFNAAIEKAHLGAHKSILYLSDIDIKDLAKKAGLFVVIINEILFNPNIT
jgi:enamine deaminase RidA (YjgF/YER057c/UK114 family)